MNLTTLARLSWVALCVCIAISCASPSHVDQHWGESIQLNTSTMVANPEAGTSQPVEGLDPVTGGHVAERYYDSQSKQRVEEVRTLLLPTD